MPPFARAHTTIFAREGCLDNRPELVSKPWASAASVSAFAHVRAMPGEDMIRAGKPNLESKIVPLELSLLSFSRQDRRNGLQQNPAVEQQAPFFDIGKIQHHANFKGRIRAGHDLPKPGDTGFHVEAPAIFGTVASTVLYRVRARANQGHVAFQDVPQLWQFVETVFAKKPAKASDTRIIGDLKEWAAALVEPTQVFFQPVRACNHCPKLEAIKFTTKLAQTQRAIDGRTMRLQLDDNADNQHQRPEEK